MTSAYEGLDENVYPGAAQYFESEPTPDAAMFPAPDEAEAFKPEYTIKGCGQKMGQDPGTDEIMVCEDENAPDNPAATVVLAGGSHAGHIEAAFKTLGQKHGWEVLVVTKSSCVFGLEELPDQTMCGQWNENFINWLDENDVDLVVTPGTRLDDPEYIFDAAPKWWNRISETETDLLLMRGTPRFAGGPECLASGGSAQECGASKSRFAETNPLLDMELPDNVYPLDMTKYVCPQISNDSVDNCDAVVGNTLVWYDSHHFTTPFSQSLAPGFEAEIERTLPHLLR